LREKVIKRAKELMHQDKYMVDGLVKKKVVVGYKCPKSYMSLLKEGLESWNEELNEEYENRPV
jgi:hypothetical protein